VATGIAGGPAAVVEDLLLVEYFHFALQCYPSGTVALDLGIPDGRVLGGPGGATLRSGTTDHYAPIRLELWPAEPAPDATRAWDEVESAAFSVDAVELRLTAVTAGIGDGALLLAATGGYRIRAHVAQTAPFPEVPQEEFGRDLERWVLQVWPDGPA